MNMMKMQFVCTHAVKFGGANKYTWETNVVIECQKLNIQRLNQLINSFIHLSLYTNETLQFNLKTVRNFNLFVYLSVGVY